MFLMHETTTSGYTRQFWRNKIIPFGGLSPDQKLFPVGWKAHLVRFEEIITDLKDIIVRELTGFRHILSQHVPDLLQQGWLRLCPRPLTIPANATPQYLPSCRGDPPS